MRNSPSSTPLSPLSPRTPPRHGSRALWVTIAGMLLLFAVTVTGGFVLLIRGIGGRQAGYKRLADTLPGELSAAKAEGLPLTPADLRPKPPIP